MNNIKLLWSFLIVCLLAACYDDKGNYDYMEKLSINVSGIEDDHTVLLMDTIKFRPEITPADRKYECFWGVLPKNGYQYQFDTISKEKDWDYVVNLNPGAYKLRFCARDVTSGVFTFLEYSLSVVTDMSIGWWVLKEENGKTDLDVFSTDRKISDLLKTKNGNSLDGSPRNMAFVSDWLNYDEEMDENVITKTVFVASDQEVVAVDFFSGAILRNFDNLFYNKPDVKKPQDVLPALNSVFLVNDNKLYSMLLAGTGKSGFFGDAQLGPVLQVSPQRVTHKRLAPVFFDEKSCSFFTALGSGLKLISFPDDEPPVNNLNAELLYIGAKMGFSTPNNFYALMKSKTGNRYTLSKLSGEYVSSFPNPMISTRVLDNSLGILSADYRTMAKDYNLMFFSKGNELWAFDVEELSEVKQEVSVPVGEKITYMEDLRFTPAFNKDMWFNSVIVGTSKNGNYTLYRYDVVAGKLQPAVKIGEGTGEVTRACYLHMNGSVYETELL